MGTVRLILLPGLDGTDVFLRPLLAALPAWIDPVVVSYPDTIEDGASYPALLPRVREAVAQTPTCVLFGWSFGGPLALMAAAAEPGRVRAIILVGTFVQAPSAWMRRLRFLLAGWPIAAYRLARRVPLRLLRSPADPWRAATSETRRLVSSRVVAARLRAVLDLDAVDALRSCPQPILYLASKDDELVPAENVTRILSIRPSVRVVTIGRRHLSLFTDPTTAADAIATFAREHVMDADRTWT